MKKNESCDLKTALEFCGLAKTDIDNAGLYYYNVACITDNAIMRCGGKHRVALKNLSSDQINQLASAYSYLASNPKVVNKLTLESISITNRRCYLRAAEKLIRLSSHSSRFKFAGKPEQSLSTTATNQAQPHVK